MNEKIVFEKREDFRRWLEDNGQTSDGIWVIFGKTKALKTLSANDALEEALCFGWIDGLINSIDEDKYMKYFARRRKDSKWSEKNKKLIAKLTGTGRMTKHGILAIEEAKKNGKWEKIQDTSISDDQKAEFEHNIMERELAFKNYCSMSPSTQKQFVGFYFEAKKEETRQKRLEKIVGLLEQNKKLMG